MSKKRTGNMPKYILLNDQEHFAASASIKSVRTNLLSILSTYENGTKMICFTSPEEGSGSTLNCVNVAVSFAKMGARVLLIDADMRRPSIHNFFNIKSTPGLSDCLVGTSRTEDAIVTYSDISELSILPAGAAPPNPTELLLSARFNELLNAVKNEYDYVFIDAPAACSVTDAAIISTKTLGAVLICRSGQTKSDIAKKAKHIIEQGGGKIIGTILNSVSSK